MSNPEIRNRNKPEMAYLDLATKDPRFKVAMNAAESSQFTDALRITSDIISDYPESPCALILKAKVLKKMDNAEEALSVALNAKELLHKNESMLQDNVVLYSLQLIFQWFGRLELGTECYEHACNKFPNNVELLMGLFNCHVQEYSLLKQQETALKMYQVADDEQFLLFAVCSIQLQVLCGKGEERLLQLALNLLQKHTASKGLSHPEALLVFISIWEQQERYGDALELLESFGSILRIELDKLRIKGKLVARTNDYFAAAFVYQKILELRADDWEAFEHYLSCLLDDDSSWSNETINAPIHPLKFWGCNLTLLPDEEFDFRLSIASAFVKKLQGEPSNKSLRNPYLAQLEIERRKCLFGKNNGDVIIKNLLQYYSRFGHLACFTSDVEPFLLVLSSEKQMEFVDKLKKNTEVLSEVPTKALGQSIALFKTQEMIENMFSLPVVDLEDLASQMTELYFKNLSLSKDLDPHEAMHGEELLSLVCNVLVQLFWRTKKLGYFIEAIMVLEFGLTIRSSVWQYKILLLHLYSHYGVISLAYDLYKSLGVRSILMETFSHHILSQMLVSPFWSDLSGLLNDYLDFMSDCLKRSGNYVVCAYRDKKYTNAIELVRLKERMQHSNQHIMARVESPILLLKQHADSIEDAMSILECLDCGIDFVKLANAISSKSMTFNEDFQSRPWWTPTPDKNYLLDPFEGISCYAKENLIKEREANARRIIKGRPYLPRMIYLSILIASLVHKDDSEAKCSIVDPNLSSEFEILLEGYAKMLGFSLDAAIGVVVSVSRGLKSYQDLGSDVVQWLNFAVFLNAWNLNSHELVQHGDSWDIVHSLLKGYIFEKLKTMEPLIQYPQADYPILFQLITEPLAWHGLVIRYCAQSCPGSGKKKNKGKSTVPPLYHAIHDAIKCLCEILEAVERWLKDQINSSEDSKMDTLMSSLRTNGHGRDEGPGKVFHILETLMMPERFTLNETELGGRIFQALRSWSSVSVARKIIWEQNEQLSEFCAICESRRKSLYALKQELE